MKKARMVRTTACSLRHAARAAVHAALIAAASAPATSPAAAAGGSAPGVFGSAAADTVWFGGTRWDAVDQRWEALPDSVWTFESGVGSATNTDPAVKPVGYHRLMEGWSGIEYEEVWRKGTFRRMSEAHFAGSSDVCVGDATGVLGGDWSLWAGFTEAEADSAGWVAGQGYGDDWMIAIEREFAYSGGQVTLEYDYACETSTTLVWTNTFVDTTGDDTLPSVAYYEGTMAGHETVTLLPGAQLPSIPGPIRVRFELLALGASDEWGNFDSACGAFAVDNIELSGGITYGPQGFEAGDDGWVVHPDSSYDEGRGGDWTDIEAVSDLPAEPGAADCGLGDSVLVAWDSGGGYWAHPCAQSNLALSPWIDLAGAGVDGWPGFVLEVGGFILASGQGELEVMPRIQWFPFDPAHPDLGPSDFADQRDLNRRLWQFPECGTPGARFQIDLAGWVPSYAQSVRIGLGLYNNCSFILCDCFGAHFNSTPWFDDIRVGVFDTTSVPVAIPGDPPPPSPLRVGPFAPNPFDARRPGMIRFAVPESGPARVDLFDVAGRQVRTVFDGNAPAGDNRAVWDGRDAAGRPASPGLYVFRVRAGGRSVSGKLMLLRR